MALALQAEVCKARKGVPVQVEWVKGHAGNEGNEQADLKANEGRAEPILEQYWDGQDLIRWTVQVGGAVVEGKLRRNLELVTWLEGHVKWTQQPSHGHIRNRNGMIDMAASFTLLQDGQRIASMRTSLSDSAQRKFRVQAMHNLLPTQQDMYRRLPKLYPDGICRCCNKGLIESNAHIWQCDYFTAKRQSIFQGLC
jgi:hypothetical protein